MRNAFLLTVLANGHAENIRNPKIHPRGHKQAEDKTNVSGKEPQLAPQRLQEYHKVAFGDAQEATEYHRPARQHYLSTRVYHSSAWQESSQEREAQTQ